MKVLIAGCSGQVGFELQRSLSIFGEIDSPDRDRLDLEDMCRVADYLEETSPDLIVNAAAWTAVDEAEKKHDAVFAMNAALPELLANYAAKNNIWLIHYSSDYVYPGTGSLPWSETDEKGPMSVYGQSKLQGDQNVISSGCDYLIFRTSWVYSARGSNFMKTMLTLGASRESLSVVNDQCGVPVPARLIAEVTAQAVTSISQPIVPRVGVYNLATRGETSWYEFACSIFDLARERDVTLKVAEVNGIPSSQYLTPAKRPMNSRLSLGKIEQEFHITMPDWYSQLQLTLDEYLSLNNGEE
ncbi:dTDP-4-dehydrorhamnose reductase [Amphritea japonica]|uniref:dTDP-4-dehydrorhamnose reductase n=1 Tax=Amphritea japonica ATCC BAA-1530 TaxID=1278309 RepID=A0A7R6SRC7_9GAMM|nr:dTDP-4-dehydrorhamnose reductase [Amphritea japonica]BBB25109.1 dTDP-4-dehydrorhamnose reductase [Amphritea japonica ATCC BAA-1530]